MQLPQKPKSFLGMFFVFSKYILNLEFFLKKLTLIADMFPKLRTPKMWLDNCLKRPVSESPSTSKMLNCPKHCWNLNDSVFTIFIDLCEVN